MTDTLPSSKKCTRCKLEKDRSQFNKSMARLDRMSVYCKQCESEYKKKREKDKKMYDIYGIV